MRQTWLQRSTVLLMLAGLVSGVALQGQDAQEPEAGFRGGQMVRGTVTATAADHLAIKTEAGDTVQVNVTANTRIMKDRQPMKVADIKVGDGIGAMGVLDAPAKTVHAVFLAVMDAEAIRKAREALGKSYIAGKVTAIDELRLTILRPDGVTQVIAVDEGTSFRRGGRGMQGMMGMGPVGGPEAGAAPRGNRPAGGGGPDAGGESITLADVKVGDSVMGRGELKAGTFVPSDLGVSDPNRQRRRRPEGGAPAATPQPQ